MQIGWLAAAPSPDLLPAGSVVRAGKTKAQGALFFLLGLLGAYDRGGTLILGNVCGILCVSQSRMRMPQRSPGGGCIRLVELRPSRYT